MSFKAYLLKSLKIAYKTSKIGVIQKKIVTRFHVLNDLEEINYKKIQSKVFTKFHRDFDIKESPSFSTNQETIGNVSSSLLESKTKEQSTDIFPITTIKNIEQVISEKIVLQQDAQLVKIIVMGGQIREKVYLEKEGGQISIQYA